MAENGEVSCSRKITNLASLILLFLEGNVLVHYLKMSEEESLIQRFCRILDIQIAEFSLKLWVGFVLLERNKADVLRRVKKKYLEVTEKKRNAAEVCCLGYIESKELNGIHHMVNDQTPFLLDLDVTRDTIQKLLRN